MLELPFELALLLLFLLLVLLAFLLLFQFSFKANWKVLALGVGQPDVGRRDSDNTRWPQALLSMLHIRTPTDTHTHMHICYYLARRECFCVSVCVCVCENNKHKMHKYTRTHIQANHMRAYVCVCECGGKLKAYQFQCLAPHALLLDLLLLYLCSPSTASCALPLFSLPTLPFLVLSSAFSLALDALICLP